MENIADEYKLYWETNMFFQNEELDSSWGLEEALSGNYDSSSPDGSGAWSSSSSATSKNIVSERNRRKKLNERLFALRAIVPNISKLRVSFMGDKALVVSLACNKRRDTLVKLCEVFESLELKVNTANMSVFSGRLLQTLLVEVDSEEKENVKAKIEAAIAALTEPHSATIN